jgi:hypothetical protein
MLLREFTIDDHIISLTDYEEIYVAQVVNSSGEKVFYHEYKDYDKVKNCFNEIISKLEDGGCSIDTAISILNSSTL